MFSIGDETGLVLSIAGGLILLLVVVLMLVVFFFHVKSNAKHIRAGMVDEELREDLKDQAQKLESRSHKAETAQVQNEEAKKEGAAAAPTYVEANAGRKRIDRIIGIVWDSILGVVALFSLIVCFFSIHTRTQNGVVHSGSKDYVVLKDSSMASADPANAYISENNLVHSFKRLTLVGLDTEFTSEDLSPYSLVGILDDEGNLVFHRIISSRTYEDGTFAYQLRGDANRDSLPYEMAVTSSDIIGVFSGYENYFLGVTLSFLTSGIGIGMTAAIEVLLVAAIASRELLRYFSEKRYLIVAEKLDKELSLSTLTA